MFMDVCIRIFSTSYLPGGTRKPFRIMEFLLIPLFFLLSPAVQAHQTAATENKSASKPAIISGAGPVSPQQTLPGVKIAPPSISHPKVSVTPITKFYPASSEQTADAILADSLLRLYAQGDAHVHVGEYNHTINLNRIVVQGDPHNMEAYGVNWFLLWSTVRKDEAIAFVKEGIKANPNTYYMYDEMGNLYSLSLHDPGSAIPYYEQAVKCKDCPFTSWNSLAHCYEKTNQWDKSVQTWETAAQYLTKNPAAQTNLARARAERDKRKTP